MSMRRTLKGRGGIAATAITTGLLLAVTGCGGDGGGGGGDADRKAATSPGGESKDGSSRAESSADAPGEPLAEVKGSDGIRLSVSSAKREDGGFVTVTGEVTNTGSKFWSGVAWKSDEAELGNANPSSVAAAKLVDKKGKKRYYVLRDTEGRCLCTTFKGGLRAGASKTWYAQFPAPPAGNDEVEFQIADLPTAGITVSGE